MRIKKVSQNSVFSVTKWQKFILGNSVDNRVNNFEGIPFEKRFRSTSAKFKCRPFFHCSTVEFRPYSLWDYFRGKEEIDI